MQHGIFEDGDLLQAIEEEVPEVVSATLPVKFKAILHDNKSQTSPAEQDLPTTINFADKNQNLKDLLMKQNLFDPKYQYDRSSPEVLEW
jgi:hypothetical protein